MSAHTRKNRRVWNATADAYQDRHAEQLAHPLAWGVWELPEAELGILGDLAGRRVLELGCGASQWATFLAREGVTVTGLDLSERQLAHARRFQREHGVSVPLVHADAERIPFADRSFDLVFCDHGAMSWADPHRTVPESARVMRPGGRLVFNTASPFREVCWDAARDAVEPRLLRDYFGPLDVDDDEGVTFQLGYGEWIRLFRAHGLIVDDLVELRPPAGATTTYEGYIPLEWARRWPGENVWVVRREG